MVADFWRLPSWEQLPYVDTITERTVALLGSNLPLLSPNNRRIGFIVSLQSSGSNVQISTLSSGTANGILLDTSMPFISVFSQMYGPLVMLQWYATSSGSNVSVIEMVMKGWPQAGDNPLQSIVSPPTIQSPIVLPKAPGVNNQQGVISYWQNLMSAIKGKGT